MSRALTVVGIFSAIALLPLASGAAVVINEALFDPTGSDTGLENIELYNSDGASASLGGWELYPDGIGYFIFPQSFSLAAGAFVTVHLRASGNDDGVNLYHASASANMGNSSGSIALFRPGGRPKDTIVDFVRYHKPGSSERKTWESTAVEAGLWVAGDFFNIANSAEGNSIALLHDGDNGSSASWGIASSPTLGKANGASPSPSPSGTPPPTAPVAATSTASADSGRALVPSLGADAGPDATAIAGAVVEFRGVAFGLDREPLPGARFLWNFGDGSVKEGKSITYIYHFPGTYHANLAVSSGELAGSDWRVVTVLRPDIRLSEVKPGPNGFVELWNGTDETIDLGGIRLSDGNGAVFSIPPNTRVSPRSAIVFPSAITWVDPQIRVILGNARGDELDAMTLAGSPGTEGSWENWGPGVRLQQHPSPGTAASEATQAVAAAAAADKPENIHPVRAVPVPEQSASAKTPAPIVLASAPAREVSPDDPIVPPLVPSRGEMSVLMAGISRGWVYFSASFMSSVLIALAALGAKRWLG
ncbi:MAG: hypothetical protein A3A44_01000 [Candidatus Sungbacteria bacterium RIFCSPLOWO2_01_FULL_60_25]|uniref:PKD domain-containing protein n=1 Tax=Candidatus Sungbacteria bacterium RIFCSPLOWO2_01_FULL_60_25 TaxID=1802281 RepID=A0A1G2LFT6_9BACT|nr:MAG: hypothetical protein A3A44_01000 [Candidatus Sungbacteria bacterium RIFCSPLOWO2_01_FULL_60_25]